MSADDSSSAFQRSRDLFLRALDVTADHRSEFLERECGDGSMRAEVEQLLSLHDSDSEFLERSAIQSLTDAELMDDLEPGEEVAGFTIISVLGRGGMGVVYRARQQAPDRDVALKLIRPGLLSRDTIRRLVQEASMLGRLQHPGIAQVFQAGTTLVRGRPRPYLVMELVEGISIGLHADSHAIDLLARIELFRKTCDAVHHAHVRGVIHRDLKPANIIVDASGNPRVLDFGIARLTQSDNAGPEPTQSISTRAGQVVGTLAYMSPEQAGGNPAILDSRTDVYSLGVVLYELLCGSLPIDISAMPLAEALHAITQREPTRPSSINPAVKGDLEAIILHAIDKDPARRYQHASLLADDLHHYLNHEPVHARPLSTIYSIRKFARRNRVLVSASAALAMILVVAVSVIIASLVRVNVAVKRSDRINNYLREMLQLDPAYIRGSDLSAIGQMLDSAAQKTGVLNDDPRAKAMVNAIIGNAYYEFGYPSRARPLLDEAYPILAKLAGPTDRDTLFAMDALAILCLNVDEYAKAESMLRESIRIRRATSGEHDHLAMMAQNNLIVLLQRIYRLDEALTEADDLVARQIAINGSDSLDTASAEGLRAGLYTRLGRAEEADAALRHSNAIIEAKLGPEHPSTLSGLEQRVEALSSLGQNAEAAEISERVVRTCRASFGPESPRTIEAELQYFPVLIDLDRLSEADAVVAGLLERFPRAMGENNSNIVTLYGNAATLAARLNDDERANDLAMMAERKARALLGDTHPAIAQVLMIRASTLRALGETPDEYAVLKEAFERATTLEPQDDVIAARAAYFLAQAASALGDTAGAEKWNLEAQRRTRSQDSE